MLCEIHFVSNFTPLELEFPKGWKTELKKHVSNNTPQLFMNIAKYVYSSHFLPHHIRHNISSVDYERERKNMKHCLHRIKLSCERLHISDQIPRLNSDRKIIL